MSLREEIIARIAAEGPMRLDDYMLTCLLHPTKGYYATRDPLGAAGDFTTAPEISQMFGELVGLALAQSWMDQGAPDPFVLAELGPGRGTLMADVLRATRGVPGFHAAARIALVEASPVLRARQLEALAGHDVTQVSEVTALPEGPLFLLANEFFDALPIRQFIRQGTGWRERQVGLTEGALGFGLGPVQPQPALAHRLGELEEGEMVEVCSGLAPIAAELGERIARFGGAALIFDYGDWRPRGDTFQAVRRHRKVDPLEAPGAADLTAHVDFEALAQGAEGAAHSALTPMGVFLERLGITARARALAQRLEGAALDQHVAAHRRLTHPEEMGNLFKVIALYPRGGTCPPGLET
jgi:SAM-dependent MidA family methyltransferase